MSTVPRRLQDELEPIASPHVEPRLAFQALEPRKVNNLTLIDGKTFLSTTVAGDITPAGAPDVGFFHDDTRFLSRLELRIGGHRAVVLSSSTEKTFSSQIELTTGNITLRESFDLPENTIHIRREQVLANDVFFDHLTFENFNLTPVDFVVEVALEADFVDVFQVRGLARSVHGQYYREVVRDKRVSFYYRGRDGVMRQTQVEFSAEPSEVSGGVARWELRLEPLKQIQLSTVVVPLVEGKEPRFSRRVDFESGLRGRRHNFSAWERDSTSFDSSNDVFDGALATATGDFHALQIPNGDEHIIAAGIPWFATVFGRDSIIAAYQSLALNPRLAVETLRVLARYQGKQFNDWQDEEPGKILHEYRNGEMTRAGEMPFGPYYGSVDATPLFLILLGETFNWTADERLVRDLLPNVYAALDWIDRYGDLDGDGFVEYRRRSPKGLINQGWKDSWDANMHADGTVAKPPIALIEVQGYVYEAKYRMASLLRAFGDAPTADRLKRDAAELARRVEKAYWMSDKGYYAMALDAEKRPLQVVASNPGHLLFTRLLPKERARAITNRMMREDMFTGWGLRTMSQREKVFNPLSYHRGSVWPHDNSIIAHGMALNEFREPAIRILTALYQAALEFRDYRLPELFCGVQRREHDEPVHYPVSCSPQAWASGALFLLLQACLGLRPDAPRRTFTISNPQLSEFIGGAADLYGMRVGGSRVSLHFARHGQRTHADLLGTEGDDIRIQIEIG